ncbi:MAG: hemerythrin domain-containing protein [Candidatus Symbiothrix sp.]|jgi:regulator of cell morphogenesis and NO signaling|nr:hemerythrin domain-containing protein [Candidatus Symbiothrix sp.]
MNTFRFGKYSDTDTLSRLIGENYAVLSIMSRFGIPIGFGDQSIREVCSKNQVDTETFLAIIRLLTGDASKSPDTPLFIPTLIEFLRNSHNYFLDYRLPDIRKSLTTVLTEGLDDLNQAVLKYFDQFAAAVRKHMMYENTKVFPNVTIKQKDTYSKNFHKQHESIETSLAEFKNILIKYYSAPLTNEMNRLLVDIFNCEQELALHNAVEDKLFLPAIA